MVALLDADANSLLKAIVRTTPGSWRQGLELVKLPLGKVLHEPYIVREDVYFPVTAVVSLLHVLTDGHTAEIAVVGNEGVVGLSLFMGDGISPSTAVVQCAGSAIRLNAELLKKEFSTNGRVALLLLRYSQALIAQMSQTAVCNRHHPISQHLCRWLLLMLDRHAGDEIVMTQELIAEMLGVRRTGVSEAAALLQQDGLIRYRRGRITVLDRPAIEQRVCECYAIVRSEYDRLLPALDAAPLSGPLSMRNDASRLQHLRQYAILDTPSEEVFDAIARQTADVLGVPIAMVSLLDETRDWFKACVGFRATESPAETSFCNVFFATDEDTVVVENTLQDPRFASNPFVRGMPFIRFYAAVRLALDGQTVGTLCVYDVKERRLHRDQVLALESFAAETVKVMQDRIGLRSSQAA